MDRTSLKIGYAVGAKGKARQEASAANALLRRPNFPPREIVDVYAGNIFVQQMPLRLLTRFSTVAAEAFPRPKIESEEGKGKGKAKSVSDADEPDKKKSWAEDDEDTVDVSELTKQVMSTGQDAKGSNAESSKAAQGDEEAQISTHAAAIPVKRVLILQIDEVSPPNWMHLNKLVHGSQRLSTFHLRPEEETASLVNTYAAALSLGMRPFPLILQDLLRELVTVEPPTAERLRYFYDRLPECTVLTRIITSTIEHWEKGHYTEDQAEAIHELVAADDWLNQRFKEIQDARSARRKENSARRKMMSGWAELEKGLKDENAGLAPGVTARSTTASNFSGAGQGAGRQRQRPRRQQQGNVKTATDTTGNTSNTGKETKGGTTSGGQAPKTAKPKADRFNEAERRAEEAAGKLKAEATKAACGQQQGSM
ncbi:hypothetical protein LTR08_008079 [Meristemomyces frigidus]|nr:hypothetical protein LTR08_008079 [Meristemomyces frigidus]